MNAPVSTTASENILLAALRGVRGMAEMEGVTSAAWAGAVKEIDRCIAEAASLRGQPLPTAPQRYDMEDIGYRESMYSMEPDSNGDYVKWADIASLFATPPRTDSKEPK